MTHLRKMMLEELERRNYAQTTINCYLQTVEDFARYFRRPPDQLAPEHIREYQAYLFRERKLAASTVTQRLAALRFFYTRTIQKVWSVADTPYPKKTRHLPSILSPEEVAHLIDSSQTQFHRMVLMTLYGTGVRRSELTRLQIPDIDSRRMVIHIRGGKGRQDRDVMLSPTLLEALRDYWRGLKRKPTDWLFPGGSRHTSNRPITPRAVRYACQRAAQRAGLQNRVHPHTLRHYASSRTMLPELIPTDSARVLTQNTRHSFPAFSSCHADGQEEIPCTRCLKIHAPSNVCTEDCSVSTSIPTLPF
ncbi:MAG: integrase [Acidobacteria bacterium]|nr:MAG: integrase [Acidobacteriota bacterium]